MHWSRAGCAALLISSVVVACGDDAASSLTPPAASGAANDAPATGVITAGGANGAATPTAGSATARGGATGGTGVTSPPGAGSADPAADGGAGSGAMRPAQVGPGMCCSGGDCLCHSEPPNELSGAAGPYGVMQYAVPGVGCVYYPLDAAPPFAAVAIADGLGGSGGCGSVQTGGWGPLYASHGIAAMIVETGSGAQPNARGEKLSAGVAAFKAEQERRDSPLFGKLAGRYGTSGFAMGGGGSTYAAQLDSSLRSSVADCASLPAPGASASSLLAAITDLVPLNLGADQNIRSVRSFETYYYQAAVELGQYGPLEQHLEDLIEHPGTYTMDHYAPDVPSKMFNPATMIDIGEWVKTEAQHIILVYGQNDPWTAGAYDFDPSRDIHAFVVPDGNHGASLTDRNLPPESRDLALEVLENWTGVAPRRMNAATMAQAEKEAGQALFFHLPPVRLRL